ncbi:thiamine pyrophosphate-dependent dehydrogenase E1 component subunit alpha [Saccharothrix deserti]|uniref:thiamine pyrophosphate-dependent dehydrogenase E1 component subunit alpha n=1 Tax=Saccharothrix deserti TaxID=2593674 RepID=UPI00131DAE4D|nr:thiamine pyrophosphate-dependent dehydrogenase E1 component subunit alpha [Saccharothrix deserti]
MTADHREPLPLSDDDLASLVGIRHFELALLRMFGAGELNGTTHTCLGQEYVPVALAPLLRDDFVLSNHRGHGHYLARYRDPEGLLAEIMGREGAVCSGVGGSQHVHRDGFLSTGVQGQSVPLAVGIGLRFKRAGERRVAAAFIGDGTWGEGAVYEGLNMAALWQVPVLVVVEHNGIAQSTPTELQLAGTIAARAAAFDVDFTEVVTKDIADIRAQVAPVVARVRDEHRPAVVQFTTHRLGPHSKGDDTRGAEELAALREWDWHGELAARLGQRFRAIDDKERDEVERIVERVRNRPPATWAAPVGAVR